MYGVPDEMVTEQMRTSAKAVNFGIMYGKGAFSLGKDLGISVKEAQEFIDAYLGAYPQREGLYGKRPLPTGAQTATSPPCTGAAGCCRN